jgi:hypothetical protein
VSAGVGVAVVVGGSEVVTADDVPFGVFSIFDGLSPPIIPKHPAEIRQITNTNIIFTCFIYNIFSSGLQAS